jgi:hypothetical protein
VNKHPVDEHIACMSERDQRIAEELHEEGFSDEDLYAALSSPNAAYEQSTVNGGIL